MGQQLFTNNARTTLAAAISGASTSLTLAAGTGALFPSPTGGDFFVVTLATVAAGIETNIEIVTCTARASDVLTVTRAMDGATPTGTALTHAIGDVVSLRDTAGFFSRTVNALAGAEVVATKNASGGYVGLSGFMAMLVNAAGTVTSFIASAATSARTWTFPDKSGTVAMTSDITGTNTGTNTGDQTITLTGDVTGSGTGSFAATLAANAVTLAKMAQVGTLTLLGRNSAGTGNVESLSVTTARGQLGINNVDNTADASKPISAATQAALDVRLRVDTNAQGLSAGQKSNATTNLGLAAVATSGAKADVGLGNVDNTSDANKPVSTAQQTALNLKQDMSGKDATGGYAGLTGFSLNLKNAAGTILSVIASAATAARTWTFPDKSGTVAMTSDITGTNSGTNTGDQTITLTGDVTGSGTGSFAATIATNAVSLAKMAQVASAMFLGRSTAGTGNVEAMSVATARTQLAINNVDNTADTAKPVSTAQANALATKQDTAAKDVSNGYAGLTLLKINFRNAASTITSWFTNANTAARTYTFQDRDGTIADDTDLATKANATNGALTNPTITNYTEGYQNLGSGTAFTINLAGGTLIELTTSGNTTITLPAAVAGKPYVLIVNYGGVHTLTFTGGTTLRWTDQTAPTPTSVNGRADKYVFTGSTSYTIGQDGGRNF
jgi:uncharacterized protein YdeI (BOF family)